MVEPQVARERREPGQVLGVVRDIVEQHLEAVLLRPRAGSRPLRPRGRRAARRSARHPRWWTHRRARTPLRQRPALRERHRVAVHDADALEPRPGDAGEAVRDVDHRLGDDRELAPFDDRERVRDEACERVLDRQHGAVDVAARAAFATSSKSANAIRSASGYRRVAASSVYDPALPGYAMRIAFLSPRENDERPPVGGLGGARARWRDRPSASRDPGEADKGEGVPRSVMAAQPTIGRRGEEPPRQRGRAARATRREARRTTPRGRARDRR